MSIRTPAARFLTVIVVFIFFVGIFQHDSSDYTFLPKLPLKSDIRSQSAWLRERMSLSETSWQKSVELRESFARSRPSYPQIAFFGKNTFTIWDYFPATWTCPHDVQRVGQMGDGGKWVCGMSVYEKLPAPSTPPSPVASSPEEDPGFVIYSFGVNHDSSFEAEMLERVPAARAWGYDFSVDGWGPQISENANSSITSRAFFKKAGLGRQDDTNRSPPFYSLPSIMKQNNHSYIDILKIDIEGHEFEAFDALMDAFDGVRSASGESVLPIGQVMIELHINNLDFMRFKGWWERIERMGMRPTWMEVNLLAVTLGNQKSNPSCTEYVWVNARDERNVLWKV